MKHFFLPSPPWVAFVLKIQIFGIKLQAAFLGQGKESVQATQDERSIIHL